ncbi:hypothetical protein E5F05_13955 [Deinococcus metallilatus]|uniref:Uncharacterized protein n=1 Tax=Deinococcus metallilatus TaxID=1211322 RepID=A0AAJ5F3F7_9DEIO|nr:hypothetical protein [Deinococcus metallilatus]MBB5294172.1 hypothetical protein [Deinococcus metallilatus]QBY08953.1 hypothetical protein E5F05_13955 [Deinococcus metallilatus]RXJ10097.1 hypothetical protein ERJ73_12785 [Deinococcus metallilatus]TLK27966.1 hypothetical protein FCS05_08595 [Deinococcus metallilatus]GMA16491.1 hypothetical protein GCM10025871_28220 [Deinococcus metallilatus]
MKLRRLLLPAVFLLGLLGLGAWAYGVFWPVVDVRVVNWSGAALRGLRVCFESGECAERAELGAGRTWRVPLEITGDNGATLTFDGLHGMQHANAYVTPGMGVHGVVRPSGAIEQEQ